MQEKLCPQVIAVDADFIATGKGHADRSIGRVWVAAPEDDNLDIMHQTDTDEVKIVHKFFVKDSPAPPVSTLPFETQLSEEELASLGVTLEEGLATIRSAGLLHSECILLAPPRVEEALGLVKGKDFKRVIDVTQVLLHTDEELECDSHFTLEQLTRAANLEPLVLNFCSGRGLRARSSEGEKNAMRQFFLFRKFLTSYHFGSPAKQANKKIASLVKKALRILPLPSEAEYSEFQSEGVCLTSSRTLCSCEEKAPEKIAMKVPKAKPKETPDVPGMEPVAPPVEPQVKLERPTAEQQQWQPPLPPPTLPDLPAHPRVPNPPVVTPPGFDGFSLNKTTTVTDDSNAPAWKSTPWGTTFSTYSSIQPLFGTLI